MIADAGILVPAETTGDPSGRDDQQRAIANLLLLKSNPLESIDAWSEIDHVILRGAMLKRESLAAGRRGS